MRYLTLLWLIGLAALLGGCANPAAEAERLPLPSTPWLSPTLAIARTGEATATLVPPPPATQTTIPATFTATLPPPTVTSPPPSPSSTPLPPSATVAPSPSASVPPASMTPTLAPPPPTMPPPTMPPPTVAPTGVRCFQPADDYTRVEVRGHTLTRRTLAMLNNAQALYGGPGSMTLLIQGSYDAGLGASFGTHDGGGAVDIWMVYPGNTSQLLPDIEQAVWALRQSGFAAWFRPANMLYDGMYPHIHAIAIGDADLSESARAADRGGARLLCRAEWLTGAGIRGAGPAWRACALPVDAPLGAPSDARSRRSHEPCLSAPPG